MSERRVLIIDDRAHDILWLKDVLLQDFGYEATFIANEKAAMEEINAPQHSYALAIIDIMIPVAELKELIMLDEKYLNSSRDTGIRLCKFIRNDLGIDEETLPIIALSERSDDELIQQLDKLGIPLFSRSDLEIEDYLKKILQTDNVV